jgi:oligosaccharide repeat unit polymerase
MYAGIWGMMLALFELKLIDYYDLSYETWIVIIDGFSAFFFGSVTMLIMKKLYRLEPSTASDWDYLGMRERQVRSIRFVLWLLSIVSFLAVAQHWYILLKMFGSFKNVIVMGNILYSVVRSSGELKGGIPYFDAFALSGTLFGGIYTALRGKVSLLAIAPILIVVSQAVSGMGRAALLVALILFLSGYFLAVPRNAHIAHAAKDKFKIAIGLGIGLSILVAGAEFVRANRHVQENINGASESLNRLSGSSVITPTIYLYLSGHPGVLNQYLKTGEEKGLWGGNTFSPIYRILAKFGADTYVSDYESAYRIPVRINTGTYLRELHADFGDLGVLLVPYVLGLFCSFLWFRYEQRRSMMSLALLAHLYIIVGASFFLQATRWGYWLVSLLGAIASAIIIDRRKTLRRVVQYDELNIIIT